MELRFKNLVVLLSVVTLLLSFSQGFAESIGEENEGERGRRMKNFVEELDITPEQQAKLKEQRDEHRERIKELLQALRDKRKGLAEELEKTTTDKDKIDELVSEIKGLHGQLIDERVKNILQMKTILTHEQFSEFKEKIDSFKEKRRGRRHDRIEKSGK